MKNRMMLICILVLALLYWGETNKVHATITDMHPSHWAAEPIHQLIEWNIWPIEQNKVRPNDYVTRGETIEMLAFALQMNDKKPIELAVQDVEPNSRYYDALCGLIKRGIISDQPYFHPNAPLKRDQLAKMLALSFDLQINEVHHEPFYDINAKHWARPYILTLADLGIIQGKENNQFGPNDYVTRAQFAKILMKMIQFKEAENNYEVIYDYLSKRYIYTQNEFIQWEQRLIELINEQRLLYHLPILKRDPALTQIAIIKAQNIIEYDYFDHYSSFYGNPWDLAFIFNYHFLTFGENLARNFTSPKETVDAWMASPGHRANILKHNYTFIGIGIKANDAGQLYIVNHFATR